MRKVRVQIAMLTRQVAEVVVEVPDDASESDIKERAWEASDEVTTEWSEDTNWGCDEGTHVVLGDVVLGEEETT